MKKTSKSKNKKSIIPMILKIFFLALLLVVLIAAVAGSVVFAKFLKEAPSVEDVEVIPDLPSIVYDVNGKEFTKFMMENREWVPIEEMPDNLINAVVAIEDHTFYTHNGINLYRIAGALWANIRNREISQGGSTITVQLAKNAFLTQEQTLKRKIFEVLYAFQLERRYTKDEILELYLNYIYYGENYYGVQVGSMKYLGKDVRDLSLSECAFIAGILQNVGMHNPYYHLDSAIARRNAVLNSMVQHGYISKEEADIAKEEEIIIVEKAPAPEQTGTYFRYMVRDYLLKKHGSEALYGGGLQIYTTIDINLQKAAETALFAELPVGRTTEVNGITMEYPQGALVSIDVETGQIRALIGGRGNDEFNRAINATRTPGSSFKPFVYTAAMERGFSPASMVEDKYINFGGWAPKNYNGRFIGWIPLRTAMEQSTNSVAVQVAAEVGVNNVISYAKKMGISTLVESGYPNDTNLSTALGGITKGVIPLEIASAYGVLANKGVKTTPYFIIEVKDRYGKVLESNGPKKSAVLSSVTSYLVTSMMQNVITGPNGTGRSANIGVPAAGKTGTADKNTDVWFVGFTTKLVTAVWMGEDTLRGMSYGGSVATIGSGRPARVWAAYMRVANTYYKGESFVVPAGVTQATICKSSGLLSSDACPATSLLTDVFNAKHVPTSHCTMHGVSAPIEVEVEEDLLWEE